MSNKLIAYLAIFLLSITAVFAANTVTLNFYDENDDAVTNVEVSVFECTDSTCSDITDMTSMFSGISSESSSLLPSTESSIRRIEYVDTGSSNAAELSIPATAGTTYYIAWAFAEETDSYLPTYQIFYLNGDEYSMEGDVTLEKKDLCLSTIQSFSVTNTVAAYEPITVSVEAALEADTYSAFELSDDGVYLFGTTGTYSDWYSAETEVTLTITKLTTVGTEPFTSVQRVTVYTDSETVDVFAGDSENVEFSWTPTYEGEFTAEVATSVTDSQCESTEEQSSSQEFTVVEEGATEYCYTLIDNLAIYDEEGNAVSTPETKETYIVSFDKITNSVAADGTLTAGETELDISVTNEEGDVDYSLEDTAAANADTTSYESYSLSWMPVSEGDNTIAVTGVAADCSYKTNNEESASLTVFVEEGDNEAPVADITVTDAIYASFFGYLSFDADISVDGSGSYDPDGTIESYAWDFGDGETSKEVSATHTYAETGTYTVTLTVTDNDDLTDTASVTVRVYVVSSAGTEETDPTAECTGPFDEDDNEVSEATVGQELLFEGDGSDEDGGDVTFSWDFESDGTEDSTDDDVFFTYDEEGSYTATFTVTDDEGATAQCSLDVSVTEEAEDEDDEETEDLPAVAVASATPESGEPTLWVQFSSEGSSGDEPLSYYWNFGTGEGSSDRANPGHYYDKEGVYTVTLVVTDADGDQDTATLTIIVGDESAEETENLADAHYFVDGIALSNDGRVQVGDDLELWVSAENIANFDKEDVTVNAIIQELGIYESSGEFDLDAGDVETKVLSISIPEDTEPGTYWLRITISDDSVKRVIYRDIIVTA